MYASPWAWEISSLVGVFASFAGLVTLLAIFDGREIWVWKSITLNTLVSTMSMVLRALLLYPMTEAIGQWKWILFDRSERSLMDFERIDLASRGPLGSLSLAWRKDTPWILRLGVIVTILALAVDPFSQQLVQLRYEITFREAQYGLQALSPRAYKYNRGHLIKTNETKFENETSDQNIPAMSAQPDLSMESAILRGLSQTDSLIEKGLDVSCQSGNCTWPYFDTLGVCHRCENLNSQLKRVPDFGDVLEYMRDSHDGDVQILREDATAVVLPNGHFLPNVNGCLTARSVLNEGCEWSVNGSGRVRTPNYVMTSHGTSNPNDTITMGALDTMIWAMSVMFVDEEQRILGYDPLPEDAAKDSHVDNGFDPIMKVPDADLHRWPGSPLKDMECALYYCVKTVDDRFTNNVLEEKVYESKEAVRKPDSWKPRNEESYTTKNGSKNPYSLEFHERYAALEMTDLEFYYPNRSDEDDFASDRKAEFALSHEAIMSISAFFQDKLRTSWKNETKALELIKERVPNASVVTNGFIKSHNVYEPQALEGIWLNYTFNIHVDNHFKKLARSMTNDMRNNGGEKLDPDSNDANIQNGHDNPKLGLMGTPATVYMAEWEWISLHGVIVFFGVIFCVLTMFNAQRGSCGRAVWKNHSLATMKQGAVTGHTLERATTLRDLEARATTEKVAMSLLHVGKPPSLREPEDKSSDEGEEEASSSGGYETTEQGA